MYCRVLGSISLCAATLVALGCSNNQAPAPAPSPSPGTPKASGEHAHGSGPHGGTVTDWGGGAYHLEFTVDHPKKQATVYVLGSDEKSPAPIKASKIRLVINDPATDIELDAQPLEGEPPGTSSRFVGVHDNIGIVQEFAGTLSGEVDGKPYSGDFKELP